MRINALGLNCLWESQYLFGEECGDLSKISVMKIILPFAVFFFLLSVLISFICLSIIYINCCTYTCPILFSLTANNQTSPIPSRFSLYPGSCKVSDNNVSRFSTFSVILSNNSSQSLSGMTSVSNVYLLLFPLYLHTLPIVYLQRVSGMVLHTCIYQMCLFSTLRATQ